MHPVSLGGPGKIVEIDGTVLTQRKNNAERLIPQQWCFRGIKRGTNKCFIVAVDHRDAATLAPLVRQYVLPGTTIMLNKWAAYNDTKELPEGYEHLTVNHRLNFIDPVTGACINTTESLWQKFKEAHKERYGTVRTLLDSYLAGFMWKRLFKEDPLYHFWSQISELYPATIR